MISSYASASFLGTVYKQCLLPHLESNVGTIPEKSDTNKKF